MNRLRTKFGGAAVSLLALGAAFPYSASATWIDDDAVCQAYGCVVVHNGDSFRVYDKYDSAASRRLSAGEPLILRSNSSIPGDGPVSPVITGSLDTALSTAPLDDQGARLGIDTNGDGISDLTPIDANGSGFLDAGDGMDLFEINASTSLVGASTSYQRSFYIASTDDFSMVAQALSLSSGNTLSLNGGLGDIGFSYQLTTRGNDDGLEFGSRAQQGRVNRVVGNVNTISDLFGAPVEIMEFRRRVSRQNANSISEQSVRFDYVYDFGGYDMAMGNGELDFEIEFDFYAR